ncbi:MAG: hypothetical protein U0746_09015 [Gemmataceae bacterium]
MINSTLSTADSHSDGSRALRTAPRQPVLPDSLLRRYGASVRDRIAGAVPWLKYAWSKPLTVVILGMHRSGTSCITRIINVAGASLGGPVAAANPWNLAGHWESLEGLAVNDLILQINGGAWDDPPVVRHCPNWMRVKMRRFLGELHADGTAVWKDPRTVLTFPLWKPYLRNYRILATLRHPLSVARSLQRRDGYSIEKGLALWREYSERLLAIVQTENRVHWVDFDSAPSVFQAQLHDFASAAGLRMNGDALASYDPSLRTSDDLSGPIDNPTQSLYAELRRISAVAADRVDRHSMDFSHL